MLDEVAFAVLRVVASFIFLTEFFAVLRDNVLPGMTVRDARLLEETERLFDVVLTLATSTVRFTGRGETVLLRDELPPIGFDDADFDDAGAAERADRDFDFGAVTFEAATARGGGAEGLRPADWEDREDRGAVFGGLGADAVCRVDRPGEAAGRAAGADRCSDADGLLRGAVFGVEAAACRVVLAADFA